MQVNDICVSSSGDIWLGTRSGLSLFNGSTFENYEDLAHKPKAIVDIEELSNGIMAILCVSKIYLFDGKAFVKHEIPEDIRFKFKDKMFIDRKNRIWMISKTDFSKSLIFENNKFHRIVDLYPRLKKRNINFVIPDWKGELLYLIEDRNRIIKFKKGKEEIIYKSDSVINYFGEKNASHYSNAGNKRERFCFNEKLNSAEAVSLKIDMATNSVDTVFYKNEFNLDAIEKENSLLLCKQNTILSIIDGKTSILTQDYVDEYNYLLSVSYHRGSVYLGTDKGFIIYNDSKFTNHSDEDYNYVWSINQLQNGDMVFGSYAGWITSNNRKTPFSISNLNELKDDDRKFINHSLNRIYFGSVKDNNDDLYFSYNHGIFKIENEKLKHFYPRTSIQKASPSLFIYYDKDKELFFRGTCPGVDIIDKNAQLVTQIDSALFAHNCILTINQTAADEYWIGASGGIAKYNYEKQKVKNYSTADANLLMDVVMCSFVDEKNNLWIGGKGGLAIYNRRLDIFEQIKELNNYEVQSIIKGGNNKMFLATIKGLVMIDSEMYLAEGTLKSKRFDSRDGMLGLELGQNGFFKDKEENIWVTSSSHMVSFNPDSLHFSKAEIKPIVKKINGERISIHNKKVELPKNENNIIIEYGTQHQESTNNVEYRYKLKGRNWSNWDKSPVTRFTNLSSGKYQFIVEARNELNKKTVAQSLPANFHLDLAIHKEPYYNKMLLLLVAFITMTAILFFRNQKLQKKLNKLLSAENEKLIFEKEELVEINKNLKLQITSNEKSKTSISKYDLPKIEVKVSDKLYLIEHDTIEYINAEDNGVRIYCTDGSYWSDQTLKEIFQKLPAQNFLKIFRSTVVNTNHIKWINHSTLKMINGAELKIGRTFKNQIISQFKD